MCLWWWFGGKNCWPKMFVIKCGYFRNTKKMGLTKKCKNVIPKFHGVLRIPTTMLELIQVYNISECGTECWENITMKVKAVSQLKSLCSHEAQGGNERNSPSAPFLRASHPSTGHVSCQEKFQVVSTLPLIVTNQAFLDRLFNVITCVSKCSGETVVPHFPFMAWPQ